MTDPFADVNVTVTSMCDIKESAPKKSLTDLSGNEIDIE